MVLGALCRTIRVPGTQHVASLYQGSLAVSFSDNDKTHALPPHMGTFKLL